MFYISPLYHLLARPTPRVLYFIDFRCYDRDNKKPTMPSHSVRCRPWNFSPQRRIAGTIRRPAMLAIAVNQFGSEIDGKSQFRRRSPFSRPFSSILPFRLSLFLFRHCLYLFPSCLHFPMFTRHPFDRERGEIPSTGHFMGAPRVDQSFILKVLCTHA